MAGLHSQEASLFAPAIAWSRQERAATHGAIDLKRWRKAEAEIIDEPSVILPGRVLVSSLGRPWRGLTVWLQHGPVEDLYIPASRRHAILIRQGQSTGLLQRQGARTEQRLWQSGECVIVPAETPSFWRSGARRDNIHIDLDPLWLACANGNRDALPALRGSFGKFDGVLCHFAHLLLQSLDSNASLHEGFADSLALALAMHLLEHYAEPDSLPRRTAGLTRQQLRIVIDAVEAEIHNPWPLESLAGLLGLSPFHFVRAFKAACGETPHRFILRLRLERARQMILGTTRPLIDIASDTGFASLSHFGQTFRRQWGTSPSQLRRGG